LPRFRGGHKVAPQLQRMRSEDLLAAIFPDQVACAENLVGERQVPDHPLVAQTLNDCLHEAMDTDGWLQVLKGLESGRIALHTCDLTAPSPFAAEAINARPYAFLDDAPLEERRTHAVQNRRYADPESADDLGQLDAGAIEAVRLEAWPRARNADEMHEALIGIGALTQSEVQREADWQQWLAELAGDGRATLLLPPATERPASSPVPRIWVAAERLPQLQAVFPEAVLRPQIAVPSEYAAEEWPRDRAIRELVRLRLSGLGPIGAAQLAAPLDLSRGEIDLALLSLQQEGFVLQGRFTPGTSAGEGTEEWCERHLLARIHRYTLKRLRREIEPVEPRDFARFLFDWQHLSPETQVSGPEALAAVLAQLEGFEAPAASWEAELLPARVGDYSMSWLDDLCTAGRTVWTRLRPTTPEPASLRSASGGGSPDSAGDGPGARPPGGSFSLRATPLLLLPRRNLPAWARLAPAVDADAAVSSRAERVLRHLSVQGASFFDEIADGTRLLRTELEDALSELVMQGRVHCDSYAGVRSLLVPASKRSLPASRRRRGASLSGIQDAGRWALVKRAADLAGNAGGNDAGAGSGSAAGNAERDSGGNIEGHPAGSAAGAASARSAALEQAARTLLRRYGVICWRLLEREAAWLPPWRELVRVYQRLEARGEIRGGRFIAGLAGEQFALPEAIALLRQVRRRNGDTEWICVAATDPSNLLGSVLPGVKVPRVTGSCVLYRNGIPVAAQMAGRVEWLHALDPSEEVPARNLLIRGPGAFRPPPDALTVSPSSVQA
jgi:ATP-dependent Lhr-like helicase